MLDARGRFLRRCIHRCYKCAVGQDPRRPASHQTRFLPLRSSISTLQSSCDTSPSSSLPASYDYPGIMLRRLPLVRTFSSLSHLSKREFAELEDHLYRATAATVLDPILQQSLATLQWLHRRVAISQDGSTIQMLLRLPSLLHPKLKELQSETKTVAENALKSFSNLEHPVQINVEAIATKPVPFMARIADNHEELLENLGPGLANVSHVVAVYSCKGGVGKSTVAVNLAYELAHMGGRIGLLDVDVYGPSLPVLVRPKDVTIRRSDLGTGMVHPIEHEHVKLLSLGFVAVNSGVPGSGQNNGAAVMRGPMAGKVVTQMLKGTDWGDLDVLILDLPPGTGDVQLQVLQDLQLSGAVAVTTPSKLAAVDTKKGIEMFTSLGVPTLAIVENMAYFVCEGGGRHYPFGRGLADPEHGFESEWYRRSVVQFPISTQTNEANDSGEPICLVRPGTASQELVVFDSLAKRVCEELLKLQYNRPDAVDVVTFGSSDEFDASSLQLTLDKGNNTLIVRLYAESGAVQRRVTPAQVRCRDPQSGAIIEDSPFRSQAESSESQPIEHESMLQVHKTSGKKSPSLTVNRVEKKGRYGYALQFGDGATIIYSMKSLALASGGQA